MRISSAGRALVLSLLGVTGLLCHARPTSPSAILTAYTEEWPPYNFTEHDAVRGIATDALLAACALAHIQCTVHVVPWARGYHVVQNTPNTVLYTTARKADREDAFIWVGPLLPRTTWVYARQAPNPPVRDIPSLAGWRIGIVRDEASYQDLLAAGLPTRALVEDSSNRLILRMMMSGIVQAMVNTEIGMAWDLRKLGLPPNSVAKVIKLSEEGAYYFALNLHTDPALVRQLQEALDTLRNEGRIEAIRQQYVASP